MEKWTICELMERAGCEKWPPRWKELLDDVMAEFEQNGCPQATPEYYEMLAKKYGILEDLLDIYKAAAMEVAGNEALSRLMVLLCKALQDREKVAEDLKEFTGPKAPEGAVSLGYDMFGALAICSLADYCYNNLKKRKLPEEMIHEVMCMPEKGVNAYKARHDNRPGYDLLEWFQLAIDGKLFDIGRLQIELFENLSSGVCVFENEAGEQIALAKEMHLHKSGFQLGAVGFEEEEGSWKADVVETNEYWEGHPYAEDGCVEPRTVRLYKGKWTKILCKGDPVIGLHIPATGKLKPELIDETIQEIKQFAANYYPDYPYKAFVCHSWLMDPQLVALLGEESNIVRFNQRFRKLTRKSYGGAVFVFIFKKNPDAVILEELPENTRLEKALKEHYMSGKRIHELTGYFIK